MPSQGLPVRYRTADGRPLISVTQTLTLGHRIDAEWFTPEACERGRIVHTLTEDFDAGRPLNIPEGLHGYVEAYANFLAIVRPVYVASEVRVENLELGLAGRIDRVCSSLFGVPGLLDFKSGDPYDWHGQQLAAYNVLRPTGARWGCYLGKEGRFRLKQYDDPHDHRKFMHDLAKTRGTVTADGDWWVTT